jgi:hypothetical protein
LAYSGGSELADQNDPENGDQQEGYFVPLELVGGGIKQDANTTYPSRVFKRVYRWSRSL